MSFWATLLGIKTLRAPADEREAALNSAPIEQLDGLKSAPTMVAGGRQTRGALPVINDAYDGAVYSSRGRGYASYNEDAAGLFKDTRGHFYALALDQAGGLGEAIYRHIHHAGCVEADDARDESQGRE